VNLEEIDAQLAALAETYEELRGQSEYDDLSGGPPEFKRTVDRLATRTVAAAARLLPAASTYRMQADGFVEFYSHKGAVRNPGGLTTQLLEVLRAFREDVAAGYLTELEASINVAIFGDFLDMAERVLTEHRTPAAVIAGFTLEEHLRKMCEAANVAVTHPDGSPKKADLLNGDLAKAGAYAGKTEGKEVTAWLGRRNDAAHAHHDRYTAEQVSLMIEGIRGFINRHPA
jgi:hypothetical protein